MQLLSSHIAKQRRAKVLSHVRGDVLELGCGTGGLYGECRETVGRYVGIDVSKGSVAKAQQTFPDAEFLWRNIDREELGFENEFDSILMVALIEHVFNQGFLLDQCFRALRPGGRVILTTPTPFGNDIVHRIGARIGLFHSGAMDDHIVIYNKLRLGNAAREFGFTLEIHQRFQMGCNQLAVLQKPAEGAAA
jgi:SAM-dependent methyltransferase